MLFLDAVGIGLDAVLGDEGGVAFAPEDEGFVGVGVARAIGGNGMRQGQLAPVAQFQDDLVDGGAEEFGGNALPLAA